MKWKMGATTVWERWNSVLPDGHVSDISMNSLNHYAYGAIAEWMYRWMCGVKPGGRGSGIFQGCLFTQTRQGAELRKSQAEYRFRLV